MGVASADLLNGSLVGRELVNGDVEPLGHPIERPGLVVRPDGKVDVAFTSFQESRTASVYDTRRKGGVWKLPEIVSGSAQPETNLVHIGADEDGEVALAWLEDSTLSVAPVNAAGDREEIVLVDDLT